MKKISIQLCLVSIIIFAGCKKKEVTTDSQPEPVFALNFNQQDLFPEGVVYDIFNSRFYVSSVTRGDIGIVSGGGEYSSFINDPALTSTTGLEIDAAKKRLYVSNASNGVGVYDTRSGEKIFYTDLTTLLPGQPVFINDIALDQQGNAYVTNSATPVIYIISKDGKASVFYEFPELALPAGSFGFNGIEYANSGYLLVASSATNTIYKIPVKSPGTYGAVTLNETLAAPDGLLLSKDGKTLVVVNNAGGGEGKVLSFSSSDKWESGLLKGSFSTGKVFPTTATSNGKNVFVLYAYLHQQSAGRSEFTIQHVPFDDHTSF